MLAVALDAGVLVDEDGQAVIFHVSADDAGADDDIVVAEDAEALGAGEVAEELSAAGGGGEGVTLRQRAAADEVAGDEDEVGVEGVDAGDDVREEEVLGVLLEVDVGELDDAEAVEGGRQVGDEEGAMGDVEIVAGYFVGVERESRSRGERARDEGAAGERSGSRLRGKKNP